MRAKGPAGNRNLIKSVAHLLRTRWQKVTMEETFEQTQPNQVCSARLIKVGDTNSRKGYGGNPGEVFRFL